MNKQLEAPQQTTSRLSVALAIIASTIFVLATATIVVLLNFLPPGDLGFEPAFAH
ncbi:hypothetical protein [Microcella sp.]|uniref:hypothetical protein n=1 Tax=Microcella sp. TaxID=1913979 RepID=UPI00255EA356|nr:hypothetical protein [Microcella sp.]MBX9471089.1 hypothetical protein [Microcella sp.]